MRHLSRITTFSKFYLIRSLSYNTYYFQFSCTSSTFATLYNDISTIISNRRGFRSLHYYIGSKYTTGYRVSIGITDPHIPSLRGYPCRRSRHTEGIGSCIVSIRRGSGRYCWCSTFLIRILISSCRRCSCYRSNGDATIGYSTITLCMVRYRSCSRSDWCIDSYFCLCCTAIIIIYTYFIITYCPRGYIEHIAGSRSVICPSSSSYRTIAVLKSYTIGIGSTICILCCYSHLLGSTTTSHGYGRSLYPYTWCYSIGFSLKITVILVCNFYCIDCIPYNITILIIYKRNSLFCRRRQVALDSYYISLWSGGKTSCYLENRSSCCRVRRIKEYYLSLTFSTVQIGLLNILSYRKDRARINSERSRYLTSGIITITLLML